jgi:hypothetical protein
VARTRGCASSLSPKSGLPRSELQVTSVGRCRCARAAPRSGLRPDVLPVPGIVVVVRVGRVLTLVRLRVRPAGAEQDDIVGVVGILAGEVERAPEVVRHTVALGALSEVLLRHEVAGQRAPAPPSSRGGNTQASAVTSVVVERSGPPKHGRPRSTSRSTGPSQASQAARSIQRSACSVHSFRCMRRNAFWAPGSAIAFSALRARSSSLTESPKFGWGLRWKRDSGRFQAAPNQSGEPPWTIAASRAPFSAPGRPRKVNGLPPKVAGFQGFHGAVRRAVSRYENISHVFDWR